MTQMLSKQINMYQESIKYFAKADSEENLAGFKGLSFFDTKYKFQMEEGYFEELSLIQFLQKIRLEQEEKFMDHGNSSSAFSLNYLLIMDIIVKIEDLIKKNISDNHQKFLQDLYQYSFIKLGIFLLGSLAAFLLIICKMN